MTHDLGDRPDPDVATPGRWRLLLGDRRKSRATAVAPVDEDTADLRPDLTVLALNQMLDNAENRLLRTESRLANLLTHLSERHRWAGMTLDEVRKAVTDEVLEVYGIAIGKAN